MHEHLAVCGHRRTMLPAHLQPMQHLSQLETSRACGAGHAKQHSADAPSSPAPQQAAPPGSCCRLRCRPCAPRHPPPLHRPPPRTGSCSRPAAAARPTAARSPARAARCTPCRSRARQTARRAGPAGCKGWVGGCGVCGAAGRGAVPSSTCRMPRNVHAVETRCHACGSQIRAAATSTRLEQVGQRPLLPAHVEPHVLPQRQVLPAAQACVGSGRSLIDGSARRGGRPAGDKAAHLCCRRCRSGPTAGAPPARRKRGCRRELPARWRRPPRAARRRRDYHSAGPRGGPPGSGRHAAAQTWRAGG